MQTAAQKREASRRRKANQRAREQGLPEPYSTESTPDSDELRSARGEAHQRDLAWAQALDATGVCYKSECRDAVTLLQIYEGKGLAVLSDEDEEMVDKATGQKKQNRPLPSIQSVQIRAIETDDGKIDPDYPDAKKMFEANHTLSFTEWLDFRDKARKDLFWLGRLLGWDWFHNSHQMICDMFVQKDFDGLYNIGWERREIEKMFDAQRRVAADGITPTKTLFLFAPRGGYKSTIDGVDAVQWMLNCPDTRILIMTSVKGLSKKFLAEIKRYFYIASRGTPTAFQLLFPEYVITGVDGRSAEPLVCPARTYDSKEPHVWISSLDSSYVGMRCDICKIDDGVDEKNSADEDLRAGLKDKIASVSQLIVGWGFLDVIGTRYFTDDWYGTSIAKDEDGNEPDPFAYLAIPAWFPKPEFEVHYEQLLRKANGMFEVTPDMIYLWFPQVLTFERLRSKLKKNKERSFKNQQLNIATDPQEDSGLVVHFSHEDMTSHTYQASAAPTSGELIVTVDWSYTDKKMSDFSVLAAVRRHTRDDGTQELVVIDIDYDKWKSSDLALKIVMFLRQHRPSRTLIEAANGHDMLMAMIIAQAERLNCKDVLTSIKWLPKDNSQNAKANRVKGLEVLLADDRLHFVGGSWTDELNRQFERFTGETKQGRKDDIPDAISFATRTLPSNSFNHVKVDPAEAERQEEEALKAYLKREQYARLYQGTPLSQSKNLEPTRHMKVTDYFRGPEPPKPVEPVPSKPQDPRMRIFGNKGPWRL